MSMRILIVEDDTSVTETLIPIFERRGYEASAAHDGQQAWEALLKFPRPNLVLRDLRLPVVSGWQILERLQNDPELATLPVIIMSGEPRPIHPNLPFVQKPIQILRLLQLCGVTLKTIQQKSVCRIPE